jgi:SAM-dependent methyltransferase
MTAPRTLHDQQHIWRHFQNAAPESFAAARPRLDWLLGAVARRAANPRPSVLNIGIGDGYFEVQALARGWEIHSLDPDAEAVARLTAAGIAAQTGQIERSSHSSATLEFVVASEVLEHLTEDQRLAGVAEIARILAPGGWFLGTVPYREILADQETVCPCCGAVFHRWGHQKSFEFADIRSLLAPAFEIETLGRTAFVPWRGRGIRGLAKSLARWMLAKLGEPIAFPTLYWIARKARAPIAVSVSPAAAPA